MSHCNAQRRAKKPIRLLTAEPRGKGVGDELEHPRRRWERGTQQRKHSGFTLSELDFFFFFLAIPHGMWNFPALELNPLLLNLEDGV